MRKNAMKLAEVETVEPNPRAVVGDNKPPEPTPFELAEKALTDLYEEAKLWMDGKPVDSQDLADGVSNLKATIQRARKQADEVRDAEKRPFLEAGREVDARYKPLLTKADMAMDACKKALGPWLVKVQQEIERKAAEARKRADDERLAAEAARRAADASNLEEREAAKEATQRAKQAEQDAARAARAKPLSGGAVGRRDGLVTVYAAIMVDPRTALNHYATTRREDLIGFLQSLADKHVAIGQHTEDEIPGFKITSEQRVR